MVGLRNIKIGHHDYLRLFDTIYLALLVIKLCLTVMCGH